MLHILRIIMCIVMLFLPGMADAKIVFSASPDGLFSNIHIMDDDGSNIQQLTYPPNHSTRPCWSPDGKHIAFSRDISENQTQRFFALFVMKNDGSQVQQIAELDALGCTWSPDGKSIAFGGDNKKLSDIYVINIYTKVVKKLTDAQGLTASPSWSPDGENIVYRQAHPETGLTTIYVMNANGTRQRPLVPHDKWYRFSPAWSPDSNSVLYVESLYGQDQVFQLLENNVVIQKYGTQERKLLKIPTKEWLVNSACWMDDGKQVLIAAEERNKPHGRYSDLYKYNLSDGKITNLTNFRLDSLSPHWISDDVLSVKPVGKKKIRWGKLKK